MWTLEISPNVQGKCLNALCSLNFNGWKFEVSEVTVQLVSPGTIGHFSPTHGYISDAGYSMEMRVLKEELSREVLALVKEQKLHPADSYILRWDHDEAFALYGPPPYWTLKATLTTPLERLLL